MKILVLTNAYPPYITGGYEIACKDNVERLREKGHDVYVLTSNYLKSDEKTDSSDVKVFRKLWLDRDFYRYKAKLFAKHELLRRQTTRFINKKIFNSTLKNINPDIIFCWNLGAISFALLDMAEKSKPTAYYISDMWLAYPPVEITLPGHESNIDKIQRPFYKGFFVRYLLGKDCLSMPKNIIFCSEALRQEYQKHGIKSNNAEIIYHGIDPRLFYPNPKHCSNHAKCRILFCGRVVQIKGIETVVEAVYKLVNQKSSRDFSLTILGEGATDYVAFIKNKIKECSLENYIQWQTPVPRERLREIYWNHDILVFPSIWLEPFSLTILEAMASGIPLVGTRTGGSSEILQNNYNSLIFEKENTEELADRLVHFIENPSYRLNIRENALNTVKRYTLDIMADKIEKYLLNIVNSKSN